MSDKRCYAKGMSTDRISIRVNPALRKRLEAQATETGQRPSDVVRKALQEHLQGRPKSESCYDLATRIGIICAVKRAPADLSTNRRHFKGFGKQMTDRLLVDAGP